MAGERRRQQTSRQQPQQQPPQRVQQAAQAMNYSAPSGVQRGYIPQNTGGYQPAGYPGYQQAGYRQPGYPGQQPPMNQNTGGMQNVSSVTGGTRGFVLQGNTGGIPAAKKQKKMPATTKTLIRLVSLLAAVAVIAAGIWLLTENNKKAAGEREEQQRIKTMQDALSKYDNLYFPGVYVDGISIGGMTPEQAKYSVESQIQQRNENWSVTLTWQGNTAVTYTAKSLNMKTDNTEEVLNKAWEPGHFGTLEERYEAMLRLREEPYEDYTAQPSSDNSKIDSDLASIKQQLDRPAQDATVSEFRDDLEEPFVFTKEEYGMNLDIEALKTRLYHMVSTMESGTLEIEPEMIAPAVTLADLEKLYAKRSSVITPIDKHSPDNRNDNIRLAFSKISGYKLDPGKTFSFNKVVGNRNTKNGFKTAVEYVYGEHVEGVGGGVCQASTTVYQAALMAGLEIRERHAHSDSVSYTGYGKDATVSDTKGHEKDLRFKNTTDYPIYIKAEVLEDPSNRKRLICKVTMYGADLGNVWYELTAECVEILSPPYEPQYIKDKNAEYVTYTDQEKKVSDAKEGYVYKSYLTKYAGDVPVEKKELYTDTYKAQPTKIYVGVTVRGE